MQNNPFIKEELLKRITSNPEVMVGKPTIRAIRISVEQILNALAAKVSVKELLEDYPELEEDDIKAVLQYAAKLVEEERVFKIEKQLLYQ